MHKQALRNAFTIVVERLRGVAETFLRARSRTDESLTLGNGIPVDPPLLVLVSGARTRRRHVGSAHASANFGQNAFQVRWNRNFLWVNVPTGQFTESCAQPPNRAVESEYIACAFVHAK